MGCDVNMAISAWVGLRADFGDVIAAAACSGTLSAEQVSRLPVGGEPGTGTFDARRLGPIQVSVDGAEVVGSQTLAAGWHLLQAGAPDGPAEVAEWFHVDPDTHVVRLMTRTALEDGLVVYGCDNVDDWVRDVRDASEGVAGHRATALVTLPAGLSPLDTCPAVTSEQRWMVALATIQLGARASQLDVVDLGRERALSIDAARYQAWMHDQRAVARWSDVGIVAGLATSAVGVWKSDWVFDGPSWLVFAGGELTSAASVIQQGALIRQGAPVNATAGDLGLSSLALVPLDPPLAVISIPAGLIQVVENAVASARAHKHAKDHARDLASGSSGS